jgi:hypothetical protein
MLVLLLLLYACTQGLSPPAAARLCSRPLFPLTVEGDRQYYFNSLRDATIMDGASFMALLKGDPLPPLLDGPGSSNGGSSSSNNRTAGPQDA